jgi:hypothetical protein
VKRCVSSARSLATNVLRSALKLCPSPAASRCFGAALRTAAASIFNEQIEVVFPVVERDFFSHCNSAERNQHNLAVAQNRLRIRVAGVIGVARQVFSRRAIDRPLTVNFEHVFRAETGLARVRFVRRDTSAAISSDIGGSRDHFGCEQAETGCREADTDRARGHCLRLTRDSRGVTLWDQPAFSPVTAPFPG